MVIDVEAIEKRIEKIFEHEITSLNINTFKHEDKRNKELENGNILGVIESDKVILVNTNLKEELIQIRNKIMLDLENLK